MSKFDFKGTGEIVKIDNIETAQKLFDEYDIPYHYISKGTNAGKIRVKSIRTADLEDANFFFDCLDILGCGSIIDRAVIFRDVDDEIIICFNLDDFRSKEADGKIEFQIPEVFGYESDVIKDSLCGIWSGTVVFRRK